jgi:hypothetical protein
MSTFSIKQPLIEKTFIKVGQYSNEDFRITTPQEAEQFMRGFIEAMEKEAGMNPSQALGFIKFLAEVGYDNQLANKTASDEDGSVLDDAFNKVEEKIAHSMIKESSDIPWWNIPKRITSWHGEAVGRGHANQLTQNIGGIMDNAWNHIKSPEFLSTVAPYAVGALGGYLIPKLLGSGGNGLLNAGIGAATVGGAAHLAKKYDLMNPESWRGFKDNAAKLISGK